MLAPSAANRQNWKFIVVENEQIKNQLVTACNNQAFVGTASRHRRHRGLSSKVAPGRPCHRP